MKVRELYPLEGETPIIYKATFLAWVRKDGERAALVLGTGGDFVVPISHIVAPLNAGL